MNCVVVEDEPRALDVIHRYAEKIEFLRIDASLREPLKAIEIVNQLQPDLLFLDVNLPGLDGFQFFTMLNFKPYVIFTTAYPEHAVKSYDIDALDYLLKPISFDRFVKAVTKAKQAIDKTIPNPSIFLKSGPQTHRVNAEDIICIEKNGNYLIFHLWDRKIMTRANMSEIFSIVPEHGFVRIHKSYVVSLKHLETIENHQVTVGKMKVPIGVTYRESFINKLSLGKRIGGR